MRIKDRPVPARGAALRAGKAAAAVATLLGALAGVLWIGWLQWPDPVIDTFEGIYVPWMLAQGKVLYRDLWYFPAPLGPYLNSLWFRLFGPGLSVLFACNAAILVLGLFLMNRVLRRATSSFSAWAACLFFLLVSAAGKYNWAGNFNFLSPYNPEAVHGLVLSWGVLLCLSLHQQDGKPGWMAAAGGLLGMVFLTKPEIFLAAGAASAAALVLWGGLRRPSPGAVAGRTGIFLGCSLVPPLLAWGLLSRAMGGKEAAAGMTLAYRLALDGKLVALPFYQDLTGLSHPAANLASSLPVLAGYLLALAPAAALALFVADRRRSALAALALSLALVALGWPVLQSRFADLGRPLPFFSLAFGALALLALRRDRDPKDANAAVLAVFALVLMGKMILNAKFWHYGFTLAVPGAVVMVALLTDTIPRLLDGKGGRGGLFRAVALVALALTAAAYLQVSWRMARETRFAVGEGRDRFVADKRGPLVGQAAAWIKANSRPGETVLVLPEGAMINYLSRRPGSNPVLTLLPIDEVVFGEGRILSAIKGSPPTFVALVDRTTVEYGPVWLGTDYGRETMRWIEENYRPVALMGAPPLQNQGFGILILRATPVPGEPSLEPAPAQGVSRNTKPRP